MRRITTWIAVGVVAGCGGGGGGNVKPPDPETLRVLMGIDDADVYENVAGTDPRDTWKPSNALESYFDLNTDTTHEHSGGTVLGSKNGITYTQRMSGPTDTIDIDYTGYFPNMPDHVQGILERAGKAWSYRLKDVLGPHQLTDGVVTRLGRDENGYAIPYHNDGILVDADTDYRNPAWDYAWEYSRGNYRTEQVNGDDFMVRSAWLELAANDIECCGDTWAAYLAAHEVGHAIGHVASIDPVLPHDHIARYVDYERGVWTGPAVTAANGGRHVAFQRDDNGEFDFGHLSACPMIMSYCGDSRVIPHPMDFAYMKDIGYTVADAYPTDPETYSYGAWAVYAHWSVTVSRALSFDTERIDDYIGIRAEAMGDLSPQDFGDAHVGSLTWSGSLLAVDTATFAPVYGDAEIILSAESLDGTVAFTDLATVYKTNMGHTALTDWRVEQLAYPVDVTGNGFSDADGVVAGDLYGPTHQEAAGTLHDRAEGITGAFGGIRER